MKDLADVIGRPLTWVSFADSYELRAGDDVVGVLWFSGSGGHGESARGRWTFERRGLLRRQVRVRVKGSRPVIATFQGAWVGTSGTLRFPDGRSFGWRPSFVGGPEWKFATPDGAELLRSHFTSLRDQGPTLEIAPRSRDIPELLLLMLLGQYLAARA